MNKKKYILGRKSINTKTGKICTPRSYRNKDYNRRYESGLIDPIDIDESKIFSQVDMMYINEMNKKYN